MTRKVPCFYKLFLTHTEQGESFLEVVENSSVVCQKSISCFDGFRQMGRNEIMIAGRQRVIVDQQGQLHLCIAKKRSSYNVNAKSLWLDVPHSEDTIFIVENNGTCVKPIIFDYNQSDPLTHNIFAAWKDGIVSLFYYQKEKTYKMVNLVDTFPDMFHSHPWSEDFFIAWTNRNQLSVFSLKTGATVYQVEFEKKNW